MRDVHKSLAGFTVTLHLKVLLWDRLVCEGTGFEEAMLVEMVLW